MLPCAEALGLAGEVEIPSRISGSGEVCGKVIDVEAAVGVSCSDSIGREEEETFLGLGRGLVGVLSVQSSTSRI